MWVAQDSPMDRKDSKLWIHWSIDELMLYACICPTPAALVHRICCTITDPSTAMPPVVEVSSCVSLSECACLGACCRILFFSIHSWDDRKPCLTRKHPSTRSFILPLCDGVGAGWTADTHALCGDSSRGPGWRRPNPQSSQSNHT